MGGFTGAPAPSWKLARRVVDPGRSCRSVDPSGLEPPGRAVLKIAVERLSDTPQTFSFEAGDGWLCEHMGVGPEDVARPVAPVQIGLKAHTMADDVYLEGALSGQLDAECSRCLARYRHALRDEFRLVLEPARDRTPADPESAERLARSGLCLGEELEAGWYRGGVIQLDGFFAEVISLALPVKPLCKEDCAGLCPRCGVNRNEESCECVNIEPSSPFAVLATLRNGSSG